MRTTDSHVRARAPRLPFLQLVAVLTLCASGPAGCASNTAPPGWLRPAEEARLDAHGAWMEVLITVSTEPLLVGRLDGELIAAEPDTLFVLTNAVLEAVPVERIRHVKVTPWRIVADPLGTWMVLGTLSTLSHGYALVMSAPIWLFVGGLSVAKGSAAGQVQANWPNAEVLRRFARFPQGLLPGIDRSAIEREGRAGPARGSAPARRRGRERQPRPSPSSSLRRGRAAPS